MDSGKGSEVPDDDDPRVMPVGATSSYDFRLPTRPDFAAIGAADADAEAGRRMGRGKGRWGQRRPWGARPTGGERGDIPRLRFSNEGAGDEGLTCD